MKDMEFIRKVQELTGAATREEAVETTRAALGTLGEILSQTERHKLASQLPGHLKEYLNAWRNTNEGPNPHPNFPLERFYNRVGSRAHVRYPEAVRRTQAVIHVLTEQVSPGEIDDVRAELREGFNELFTGKPEGPASPSRVKGGPE